MHEQPMIVGLGGTTRTGSSSEKALRVVLAQARADGADTLLLTGPDIDLPMFAPGSSERCSKAGAMVEALRRASGIVIASPGYHGSISGLIKNALDYAEDMRSDTLPYFEGRAIGLIACAAGWQATGSTLSALRSIAHALRGWPTPLGIAINSASGPFREDGSVEPAVESQLRLMARQVVEFSRMRMLAQSAAPSTATAAACLPASARRAAS